MTEIDLDGWSGSTGNRWWVYHDLADGDRDLVIPTRYRAHPSQIAGDANADRWQIILLGFTYTWMPDASNSFSVVAKNAGTNRIIFNMPAVIDRALSDTVNCFIPLAPGGSLSPIENPATLSIDVTGTGAGSITLWGLHENAYGKRIWTGSPIDYNA